MTASPVPNSPVEGVTLKTAKANNIQMRYAGGAALMGMGGVLALGCTIGNGLTGVASLAPTSFVAVPAMVLAAAATMKWRWRTRR